MREIIPFPRRPSYFSINMMHKQLSNSVHFTFDTPVRGTAQTSFTRVKTTRQERKKKLFSYFLFHFSFLPRQAPLFSSVWFGSLVWELVELFSFTFPSFRDKSLYSLLFGFGTAGNQDLLRKKKKIWEPGLSGQFSIWSTLQSIVTHPP